MATAIKMPRMSDSMTEGTLVRWLKKEGDAVTNGDMIAEIETDKATMEVECFEEGVLLKQTLKEGGIIAVGGTICILGKAGEDISALLAEAEASATAAPSAPTANEPPSHEAKQPEQKPALSGPEEVRPAPAPALAPAAAPVPGSVSAPVGDTDASRIKASPLARRLAAMHGIALGSIRGTGPGARIVKEDIEALIQGRGARSPLAAVSGAAAYASPLAALARKPLKDERIPLTGMRKTIAKRLVESKTQLPHFYLNIEVDAAPMMALRSQVNRLLAESGETMKISVNDIILKASALALAKHPDVNASWEGDAIHRHGAVHMSFAVSLPTGLITPVIRNADIKPLTELASEAKELGRRARSTGLKPEEFTGGTFTVSNLGMYGIRDFAAIINPPQVAILAVGAVRRVPVVAADGSIVAGERLVATLSADHRVVDGALGAEFLATLRDTLENPVSVLL